MVTDIDTRIDGVRIRLNEYVGDLQAAGVEARVLFLHRFQHWSKASVFRPHRIKRFANHQYSRIGYGWPLRSSPNTSGYLFYVVDDGVYAADLRTCPRFGTTGGGNRTRTKTSGPDDMSDLADEHGQVWIVGQFDYDRAHRAEAAAAGIVGLHHIWFLTRTTTPLADGLAELVREHTGNPPER